MVSYLKIVEFNTIRIVKNQSPPAWNRYIHDNLIGEWEYWQLASGEIVAWEIPQNN